MRKALLALLLTAAMLGLCGCSEANQAENLAYVTILGIDLTDDNEIELTVQIPKISGQREGGSSDSSENLSFSATGSNFTEALNALQWAVPRRLELSQIKLIVVSDKLVSSSRSLEIANAMMDTSRLYTAARLAVCKGSAGSFIGLETPVIGTRMTTELTAMFEDYTENGFIPDITFADVYYKSVSIYSDPLVVYAEPSDQSGQEDPETAQPASLTLPESPSTVDAEIQQRNRFLGAAVFQKGQLAGTLTAQQFLYCKMLRGLPQAFSYTLDGDTVYLSTFGVPNTIIDIHSDPVSIRVELTFSVLPNNPPKMFDGLEETLEGEILSVVNDCKQLGVEPFQFAEIAASSFATIEQWTQYGWLDHFLASDVEIDVLLRRENL